MKQRLAIAAAILNHPEVLVLDEPTNGLDPQGIAEIRELIIAISKEGKTIIIASHILDEIEKVCTHVAILKFGNLVRQGTIEEIIGSKKSMEAARMVISQPIRTVMATIYIAIFVFLSNLILKRRDL
jgi:ABC-2 type transport system ATP-binding protein